MLKLFCWVCFTRRLFVLPRQSTLAVCSRCGNPEGAIRPLIPFELAFRGLQRDEMLRPTERYSGRETS